MRFAHALSPVLLAAAAWTTLISVAAVRADEPALGPAQTEETEELRQAESPQDRPQAPQPGKYWLGLVCVDDPQAEPRLSVKSVIPGGPADQAGIRAGDRVAKVGKQAADELDDLVAAVAASEGKALVMELKRGDETLSVSVTPQERPQPRREGWREMLRDLTGDAPGDGGWGPWIERRLRPFIEELPRRVGPGLVVAEPMPDDMTVTITRKGSQPAEIKVTKGDQTWDLKEDQLAELPAELRPHVEHLLGRDVLVRVLRSPQDAPVLAEPGREIRQRVEEGREQARRMMAEVEERREEIARRAEAAEERGRELLRQAARRFDERSKDLEAELEKRLGAQRAELEQLLERKTKDFEAMLDRKVREIEKLLERATDKKPVEAEATNL